MYENHMKVQTSVTTKEIALKFLDLSYHDWQCGETYIL